MVSFVHAADFHLGFTLTRIAEDQAEDIREARFQAMENVLRVAGKRDADFIIVAGDLYRLSK